MKKSKQVKVANAIADDEIVAASMYFAIGNLAAEFVYRDATWNDTINLKHAWSLACDVIERETSEPAEPERKSWEKMIREGNAFLNQEWLGNRHKFKL